MKRLQNIVLGLLLAISGSSLAQQESVIAFYKDHMNLVNPAAISVDGHTYMTSTIRKQWTGIQDAPETQAVSFMSPLGKNLSIGLSVIRDKVFIEKQTFATIDFSYKVELSSNLNLYMGIKAGGNNYEVNTNGLQTYNIQADPSLEPISRFNPNVGVGFYLQHKDYYISLSTPKMLDTERAKNENGFASAATDRAHYYLSGGRNFILSQSFTLYPAIMIRYVNGAPFSADFTATTVFDEVFHLGATYRTDKSLVGLAKFRIGKKLLLGYAYEYSLRSELLGRANGSNEFYLQFKF